MTPEQFKKAQPIYDHLERVEKALAQMDAIVAKQLEAHPDLSEEAQRNPFANKDIDCEGTDNMLSNYSFFMSAHNDGSGWSVDMSGCYVAGQMWDAARNALEHQKMKYLKMLDEV